ncbi:MAG TPA: GNAT family N-acetyltransferase [Coriobacteriia bacterium]|nr:GNAT family N-acetyltransferase [Coriobacteriia bacterium]
MSNTPAHALSIIEATQPAEIASVRALFLRYAEDLGWDLASGGHFAEEIENLPGPYAPPRGALLLALVDGVPAGALGLQPVPEQALIPNIGAERFGELKRLFVGTEYRRYGVGRALMLRSAEEARARGYSALVLTTSAEMMPLAQGLYDSLGYETTEPYRDDMPWPAIRWLRLDL